MGTKIVHLGFVGFITLSSSGVQADEDPGRCQEQHKLSTRSIPLLSKGDCEFRDLNRNSRLDLYEDWRELPERRARDLLDRMTLPEKVGQLMHADAFNNAPFGVTPSGYNVAQVEGLVFNHHTTHFVSRLALPPVELAEANNSLQQLAEKSRLGIPLTISTDPRHHFQEVAGASVGAAGFTQFPEPLGFAALGDAETVRKFGDIVRQEYRATGFSMALSPQADIATEPRWPRINGTFGDSAALASLMVGSYVQGVQGGTRGPTADSVAAVVKHWVGYGAARNGLDSHNYYGRYSALTTEQLGYHIEPFRAAFANKVAGVMPAYSIFKDVEIHGETGGEVGAAYNKPMMNLLRGDLGFNGVVLSDWAITNDCGTICREGFPPGERPTFEGISAAWGVEALTSAERFSLAINAGVDQFGGVHDSGPLLKALEAGLINEHTVDDSVLRILTQTFYLGLFEAPYVDAGSVAVEVGGTEARSLARDTQSKSMVVLKNKGQLLPVSAGMTPRVYLQDNLDENVFSSRGFEVVNLAEDADIAVLKTSAPYETLYPNFFFGAIQHDGSLAYSADDPVLQLARKISATTPVIVSVYLDRPAVLTPLETLSSVLVANFGATDEALVRVLTGEEKARGKLPFELPSSMEAVFEQRGDVPSDTHDPLYPFGHGLEY